MWLWVALIACGGGKTTIPGTDVSDDADADQSADTTEDPSNAEDAAQAGSDSSEAAGTDGSSTDGGSGGGTTDTTTDTTMISDPLGVVDLGWVVPEELMLCGDRACACANGIDDDGDGNADGFDSECTGPGDDDEDSFATGIPGDNQDPKWQDCFFDGNSGAGDDDCKYATDCALGLKGPDDPDCQVSDTCIEFCAARTPNGCDCFGCCDFTLPDGTTTSVVISEDCKEEDLGACTQCVKAENMCNNPCGECELCPGRSVDDLPETCFSVAPPPVDVDLGDEGTAGTGGSEGTGGDEGTDEPVLVLTCDDGEPVCYSTADCGASSYCSFGCCVPFTLQ